VEAADDELGRRRKSGEQWQSGQGKLNGGEVCNCQDVHWRN
jgi:hypothetical protein